MRMIIVRSVLVTTVGLVIGLSVSMMLAHFLSKLIFGVRALDWLTFGGVSSALTASALIASYIPARRATRVDPMLVLRNE